MTNPPEAAHPMPARNDGAEIFADTWGTMNETQRVDFCVERAQQAMSAAQDAPDEMRKQYLHHAQQWLVLANDISLHNARGIQSPLL